MIVNQNKLSKITNTIIQEEIDYLELKKATDDLKNLFEEVSGFDNEELGNEENIYLKTGKAIAPKWAGMCIQDFMRTKRFISGVYKAVKAVQEKKKNSPVCILYAGTGPFATLVMPLITLFSPSELQLILLEVNPSTYKNLKKTIEAFDASDYIKEMHLCDASTFKATPDKQIDIVLIECLQHTLTKEPQVAITYNLLSHLNKDVILIPEQISLQLTVIDSVKKQKNSMGTSDTNELDFHENLKTIFLLNKEEVFKNPSLTFPKIEVLFSEEKNKHFNLLAITTDLTIFKDEKLKMDESGLTIPLVLLDMNNGNIKGIATQYIISEIPGIETTIIR